MGIIENLRIKINNLLHTAYKRGVMILNKLDKLYSFAEKNGYNVVNYDLSFLEQEGMIFKINGKKSVLLDYKNIKTSAEEKVVLAHEIGHGETNALYGLNSNSQEIKKCEYKATKWAVEELIPISEYLKALKNGFVEAWQLAEYFDVTEDFIRKAHYIYKKKGLV